METIIRICLLTSNPLYYRYLKFVTVNGTRVVGEPETERASRAAGRTAHR